MLVSSIEDDGPAHQAGIRHGDVILTIGDRKITTAEDYHARIRDYAADDRLKLHLWRQGREKNVTLKARSFPLSKAPELAYERTGLRVESVEAARRRFGEDRIQAKNGAVITVLRNNGVLARSGVRPGDIIRQIEELAIASPEDFYRAIVRFRRKETIVVLLQRKTQRYYITIRFGRPESG